MRIVISPIAMMKSRQAARPVKLEKCFPLGEFKPSKHPKVLFQGVGEELLAKAEEGAKGKAGEEAGGGEDDEEGEEGGV